MPLFDRHKLYRRSHRDGADFEDPNVPDQYPPDLELEPVHLDINLHVDVAEKSVMGTVTTTILARRDDPTSISLDAVDFLDVRVKDLGDHELTWGYDGSKLAIEWVKPFAAGEERQVEVAYRVLEPIDGLFFSQPNNTYPNQPWYAATDHETERARYWLPCVDLPNVRTTLEFRLRAEARFTILANGYLVEETAHEDGTKTAHWKLDQLCPSYLVCFAIGEFTRAADGTFDDGDKILELAYFSSLEHDSQALIRTFGRTGQMMAWMTKKLDMPFPYPKYYQFALADMGGAMENISLVSWSDWFILNEPMSGEAAWLVDQVNLHEMAHSYFGDAVVIRDFAHAWLKESWATYMERCWREDKHSQDEALYVYYDDAVAYFREADDKYKRPIVTRRFKSSWQLYDRHLYPGGACRLHTLRCELGDEVFWAAVRDYLRRYSGKVVETDDFRHVMEEHSGRSLGKFFDQWFHSPGYPDIKVKFDYDRKQKVGTFEIEQTQVDREAGIPVFSLSTDLGWTIDGKEHVLPIKLDQPKHVIMVTMELEPQQVRFDPGSKILHKLDFNPGDPALRRQLREARDVIGRIQAAYELAKSGKQANIQAIVDAYADERFWGAREHFAKALSKANTEKAVAGLAKIVAEEKDPMVMAPLFREAGEYRDIRLRDALGARLAGELPPIARQMAYRSMGAQRQDAQWDVLVEGSQQASFNGHAQSGAFRGLGATRRDEAVDLLLDQVGYGIRDNNVRPAIVSALADIGQGLEKARRERVVETLTDLLRDPWYEVRWDAVYGLATMKATEAIPALETFSQTVTLQDKVQVEKLLIELRRSDKSDGSALKKKVEDLDEKVRKLEEHLQKLAAQVEPAEAGD